MIDLKRPPPSPDAPLAPAQVQHEEPQTGGSFTRNVGTGGLDSNKPVPTVTTEQE